MPTPNGVENLTAARILAAATKASISAPSVRIRGTIQDADGAMAIDMRISQQAATGAVKIAGLGKMTLVRVGADAYFSADRQFLSVANPGAVAQAGKYVKLDGRPGPFADFRSLTLMREAFTDLLKPEGGRLTKGRPAAIGGVPVIGLVDGTKGTLYVATQGEPRALRMIDSRTKSRLDFIYDVPVQAQLPSPGDIVTPQGG
ncbi:hypothetical protein DPM19_12785 [Actinomadura craniellae]|uniref:LppX_LprAFG lipoprotein n=1 Tax=Actinomadura craniellae TaxID=2231787 RepID=A0A365H6K5_9ACTN|nr:hypothetical protein [Actinomadura craniellae]RAY14632.1 hypothetical protein DPM19_12785 [Actinomadura craniellae]